VTPQNEVALSVKGSHLLRCFYLFGMRIIQRDSVEPYASEVALSVKGSHSCSLRGASSIKYTLN